MFENKIVRYGLVNWKELIPLQNDNLKTTNEEEIQKLEKSFQNNGNISVLHVWENKGKLYLLDGVGRKLFFEKKEQSGVKIPNKVPAIFIDFKNKKEALKAILVYSSQYRTINEHGLAEFLDANDLIETYPELFQEIELPNIDIDNFDFNIKDTNVTELEDNEESVDSDLVWYFPKEKVKVALEDDIPTFKNLEEYNKTWITKSVAMYQFNRLCAGYNTGYSISLLFNPHRHTIQTKSGQPLFESFQKRNPKWLKTVARFFVEFDKPHLPHVMPQYCRVGIAGSSYVNEFQPYEARDIYKTYCKNGDKILDPCAGWGGRMIGVYATLLKNISYTCVEPSTPTYNGLKRLNEFLNETNLKVRVKIIKNGFENVKLKSASFDFAFTSPPYFDTEKYNDENTQSYIKFNTFEKWVKSFYEPLILNTIKALKPKSTFLLNIGNKKYDLIGTLKEICDKNDISYNITDKFKLSTYDIHSKSYANTGKEKVGEVFVELKRK